MGGDGGVVATNRTYMRGAGSASHTADSKRASASAIAEAERESIAETMKSCAITGSKLNYNEEIVVCPYGKLYGREAAVKALLRRLEGEKNGGNGSNDNDSASTNTNLGWHVRGLKDLKTVRFQTTEIKTKNGETQKVPVCPITSIELNGLQPAFLIVKKKMKKKKKKKDKNNDEQQETEAEDQPNVLSEKAIKQMGADALQEEYGPFEQEDLIRLAPPPGRILDDIKSKLEERRMAERDSSKKSKKKRKADSSHAHDDNKKQLAIVETDSAKKVKTAAAVGKSTSASTKNGSIKIKSISDVRSTVEATVASSAALSSLFTDSSSKLSDKQKKDNLFSCNC
mmetsp:Transcript_8474/g.12715  ORF Transcript_8474/g.12715 Transcript_8474/m.12715 type:complete len:341 (+) Transcript_8474:146-1168(+)|eukprot:CAMPEP_0203678440 /NCGR_PEP_ID=MMETSP0090-20130426/32035_1 /ASSEMBLY_ACC=CAM_ASM_001088 /TAXON_ID=426623 /ORGANISM="Chaetoceros affinis, Strain CCMP159" /LENGTH=340 /DNA_ID=CAMNT_0050545693 /DNA_START=101 /DNA_END=1123 /DNA_ORIENTATION=+